MWNQVARIDPITQPKLWDEFSAAIGGTLVASWVRTSCKYLLLLLLRQWELTGGKWAGGLVDQLVNSTIYVHASIKG